MPGNTKIIGNRIIRLSKVPSTNTYARQLARKVGCPEGCVVRADEQTAGKGRLGRKWDSKSNLGLWFSFILHPRFSVSQASLIPFFVSVALVESVKACFQITPQVKWPNDLLINGKKICGILSEVEFQNNEMNFVVVGVGMNLWHLPDDFPPELRQKAGSLQMFADVPIDAEAFFQQVLEDLNFFYKQVQEKGFAVILEIWKSYCHCFEKPIEVQQNGRLIKGIFHDLAPDGSLLLKKGPEIIRVVAGDIAVKRD